MGSGLVRDSNKFFFVAFVVKFSHHDIIQSEREAMVHGLLLCQDRGIIETEIEIDSKMAFNMIIHQFSEAWRYEYMVRKEHFLFVSRE